MKKILLTLLAFIICCCTLVQAQNVNQYITVYGHDYDMNANYVEDGDGNLVVEYFKETRNIKVENNSVYTINLSKIQAYDYETGLVFYNLEAPNGFAELPPGYYFDIVIENFDFNYSLNDHDYVVSISYMNYNDNGTYTKDVKAEKGYSLTDEILEDLYPVVIPEPQITETEPNDTFTDAELLNDSVVCTLSTMEDRDCFKIYVNEGDELTFKVNFLSGNGLDGNRFFKYQVIRLEDMFPYIRGTLAFNSVETEKEVTITAFNSGYHYLSVYFDSKYPDYFYTDGAYSVKAYINGHPVSVENVNKNKALVYAQNGNIHVKDAKGEAVLVYSIDGKLVYNNVSDTDDVSIRLTSGIYIVKVGKITKKVKL